MTLWGHFSRKRCKIVIFWHFTYILGGHNVFGDHGHPQTPMQRYEFETSFTEGGMRSVSIIYFKFKKQNVVFFSIFLIKSLKNKSHMSEILIEEPCDEVTLYLYTLV